MSKRNSKTSYSHQTIDLLHHVSDNQLPEYIINKLTTPPTIDKNVLKFCKTLSPGAKPIFVNVSPQSWARFNYCNKNVERMIALQGGEMVLGYKIWYVPNLYIEAERHAVWRNSKGNLVDITPNKDGERRILFLPSPDLTTVVTGTLLKPRDAFHPRVRYLIIAFEHSERHIEVRNDDTWEGWEQALSFETWNAQKKSSLG